jgi:hypothetical protein
VTALAIELNDAGIRVARPDGIVATEPGCALVENEVLAVGDEAYRAARLRPHQASDRFWTDLGLKPLPRRRGTVETHADIAFAQLSSLWGRFGTDVHEVVLVVPASFSIEQLGHLLGIAEACKMPVVGIVDAAVASSDSHPGYELLHLELSLHQAVLTRVEQGEVISRGTVEALEGVGLASLRERWVRCIAAAFISQTRFDPLHDAHAEQTLYDGLPEFLDAAAHPGTVRIELRVGERTYRAEVRGVELAAAADDVYTALAGGVERLRTPGSAGLVQIGPHAATLPGIASVLAGSRDVTTRALDPDAACMGALSRLEQIRSSDGRFKLITRLRSRALPSAERHVAPQASHPGATPTHVMYRGWVHPIGTESFTIGAARRVGGPGIEVRQQELGEPGSDAYCVLQREGDRVLVEDPGCGVLLNGERIKGRAELRVGDVVHLGSPGVPIHLVALVGGDGA